MTIQISSSQPEVGSQTPGEKQKSPVMNEGAQFQHKLCALLDAEDREKLQAKNKRTQELLQLIQKEVQKRSDEIGYNYEFKDYKKRLCMSNEEFDEVLRKKVLIGNLGEYYTELMSLYGENPVILQKLMREYCIEDLVYESVRNIEYKEVMRITEDELKERLENNTWDDLKLVKSIDLSNNNLWTLDKDTLKEIFSNLKGVKSITLDNSKLGKLDKDSLKEIFRHLQGVKYLDLGYNDLGKLDKDSLKEIFCHLQGVISIKLIRSDLGALDKDSLKEIFRHLKGVRKIDLTGSHLWLLDKDSLKEIFSNLKGVKSIDLCYNNLRKLDKDSLKEIFSHLKGVKSIKLGNNNLTDEQTDLIKQLLPDAEIQF